MLGVIKFKEQSPTQAPLIKEYISTESTMLLSQESRWFLAFVDWYYVPLSYYNGKYFRRGSPKQ